MTESLDQLSPTLQRLVAKFSETFRRVAARYRLSGADVDELIQEVRIRLWRSQSTGERIGLLGASYVHRTAVTAALVVIRRRRAKTSGSNESLDVRHALVGSRAPSPDAELVSNEMVSEVERALESLPAARAPVVRLYLAGYSREEIAELYGWSEGKTRNLLYRGLADLRSKLSERGIGPEARV